MGGHRMLAWIGTLPVATRALAATANRFQGQYRPAALGVYERLLDSLALSEHLGGLRAGMIGSAGSEMSFRPLAKIDATISDTP